MGKLAKMKRGMVKCSHSKAKGYKGGGKVKKGYKCGGRTKRGK